MLLPLAVVIIEEQKRNSKRKCLLCKKRGRVEKGDEIMVNRKPTKREKDWLKAITDYINVFGLGGLYHGYDDRTDMQRHHVLGKSAKHNKIHIGYWFVNPIPFELHDINSDHIFNVTHHKNKFKEKFGSETGIYQCLVSCMAMSGYDNYLPPDDVYNAIMDTGA